MAKKLYVGKYEFSPGDQSIVVPGNQAPERFLVITNVTTGTIIYSFADPLKGFTSKNYNFEDDKTTFSLVYDTTSMSASDSIQIFIEEDSQEFTPADDLLDPVGKMRVSNPQNLIDTDFEYGLQSTKWETLQTVNNIPTIYSSSGDTPIDGVLSVNAIVGSKNILVTTEIPHGVAIGDALSVQGLSQYQAEGYFIVTSVTDDLNFFFELDVPATFTGDISGSYTTIVPAKFFEGSTLPISTADGASTDAQDPSVISVETGETHGFSPGTKIYLRNTVGPRSLRVADSTLTAPDGRPYIDTVPSFDITQNIDNSTSTGRGSFKDRPLTTYDWESTYTFYLDPSSIDTSLNTITWASHNLRNTYTLLFNTPSRDLSDGGMTDGHVYFVEVVDADTIKLHNNRTLTSLVNLQTLNNTFGLARLGLVYKIEGANGVQRYTAAYVANSSSSSGFTHPGQIIDDSGRINQFITTAVDVTAVLGGNPTQVRIKQIQIAGDFNGGTETMFIRVGGTSFGSVRTGQQSGVFNNISFSTSAFTNLDISSNLYVSGGRTYFNIDHDSQTSVNDLGYFNPRASYRMNIELENFGSVGGSADLEHSGGDLFDTEFGLGGVNPTALIGFQGRTPFSYTNFGDAYSAQTNQRNNGRYGVLSVKYPNIIDGFVIGQGLNGAFAINFFDNNESYGTNSEIFYIPTRTISSDRNTLLLPDHGITDNQQRVTITVDNASYSAGQRFAFADSAGNITIMPQQFDATVSILNPDIIRLTSVQSPNTDDIARAPESFTISFTESNPAYNSIYISNHKVRGDTQATYNNVTGNPILPLTNGQVLDLERVNDDRLKLKSSGGGAPTTVQSEIGNASNARNRFFIPCETTLGFEPSTVVIDQLEFRGDFSGSTEYVDIFFDDGSSTRIGAFDDIGDSSTYATSTTFSQKDVTSLIVDNGGILGFYVEVDPAQAVNFSPSGMPNGWWWQLRFTYTGSAQGLVFEDAGTGAHEFLVNNLVGAYDGVFEMTSIPSPTSFEMESDFQIPIREYNFTSSNINTGTDVITFADPHNLITGERITYNNNGNADALPPGTAGIFHAIVVSETEIRVATSFVDALVNNGVQITAQTGTHTITSNNVIKNIKGAGTVSTVAGSKSLVGVGTNFLVNFKRFDKIYIDNGVFVEEKTVDTITTPTNMTIFEDATTNVSGSDYYYATQISLRPDGYSLHLPFDGGVDITAGTSPNCKIVRQSRKYFRYQSGKGIQNSFAINFNPPKLARELIKSQGDRATIITQEQHNLRPGDGIVVDGATVSSGVNYYNGQFVVDTTPDPFSFEYVMQGTPDDVRAGGFPTYVRTGWTDSFVRAGMFDDQNGFFYEYDGQKLYAVRRSSTKQIAGAVNVTRGSQIVEGIGTSFVSQIDLSQYIVIRGQSYKVVEVSSDTRLVVQPAYRGIDGKSVSITKTIDTKTPQEEWNIDPCDGNGFTGFNLNLTKIQMAYIDYSWYGAGKIRYGFKDNNGHIRYVHEYKHNNRLNESYFRSGNLPGRYEILNGPAATTAPTLFHFGTSIIMDGRFDDDKAYQFTGQSKPFAFTNGASGSVTSTGPTTFEQITQSGRRVFVYAIPVAENTAQSVTEGLQIVVDGNTELPPGTFITQVRVDGTNSKIFTSFPATSTDPTGGTVYPVVAGTSQFITGEQTPVDLTRPLPLISVRLAPSVDSGVTGSLGEREIINRMQLALKQASVTANQAVEVFLLQNALPSEIVYEKSQSPSLSEVIRHSAGDTLLNGTTIFSTKASDGSISFSLEDLLEIGNSILGGDGIFPAGPDLLTLAVQPQNTSNISGSNPFFVTGKVSWSESQA